MQSLEEKSLPKDWRSEPPGTGTMRLGDLWFRESRSAVLRVPSVLVPEEANYLLNPRHPDYERISIVKTREFFFDPRLSG